jgi:hypothetical protein
MEYFCHFFFRHWAGLVNSFKKLTILAVLHEDVDFVVFPYDFIDLGDVFMHEVFLQLNLPLNSLQLLRLVLLHCGYLDSHDLSSQSVHCLLDLSETAFTNSFPWVMNVVLSS